MMTDDDWLKLELANKKQWRKRIAIVAEWRVQLIELQGGICAICGGLMVYGDGHGQEPTVDHVLSRKMGGMDALGNLVAAHRVCNMEKDADLPTGCELIWLLAVNNRLGVEPVRW